MYDGGSCDHHEATTPIIAFRHIGYALYHVSMMYQRHQVTPPNVDPINFAPPKVKPIIVTPAIAKGWLDNESGFQRNLSEPTVRKYAEDMRRGQWLYVPSQGIAITRDGQVLDGQHRLWAVVRSGIPQKFMVHFEVDPDVFTVIDRGRSRTLTQIAAMGGCKYGSGPYVAAANTLLWSVNLTTSSSNTWNACDIVDVMNYYSEQVGEVFCVAHKGSRSSSLRGAALRAILSRPQDKSKILEFLYTAATGFPSDGMDAELSRMPIMLYQMITNSPSSNLKERQFLWTRSLLGLDKYLKGQAYKGANAFKRSELSRQPFPLDIDSKPSYVTFADFMSKN